MQPKDTLSNTHPENILSVILKSSRQTDYNMNNDNSVIKSIVSKEMHVMKMTIKQEAGNQVKVTQELILNENEKGESFVLKAKTLEEAIQELHKKQDILKEQNLNAMRAPQICQDDCPTVSLQILF